MEMVFNPWWLPELIGRRISGGVLYLREVFALFYLALRSVWTEGILARKGLRLVGRITFNQLRFTGYDALPRISFTAFTFGSIVVIQAVDFLGMWTSLEDLYHIITLIIVREVSPIIIALILIGRSCTAISTELANMKLNREVEALTSMGINLEYFIVLPRLVGFVVSVVSLVVYFNIVALVGGYAAAELAGKMPISFSVIRLLESVGAKDLFVTLLKGGIFGAIIAVVGCHHGFSVGISFREVPQVTTKAVVNAMVMCFVVNTVISISV
ncbi:MAG: ABC transporter permease [Planctomycetes bacterium]|nr:ABC transporter permease [Planctomycetota bacterium]